MTRSKMDWYKRNPAKFIGGTFGMPFELKGAYSILLDLIYDGGGSCPDDPKWIATMLGIEMTTRRWNIIRGKLIDAGKLVERNGRLSNPAASRMLAREDGVETASGPVPEPVLRQDKSEFIHPEKHSENRGDLFSANGLTPTTPPQNAPVPARARESQSQNQNQTTTGDVIVQVEKIASALHQKRGRYWEADYRRMLEEGLTFDDVLEAAIAHRQRNPVGDLRGLTALKALAKRKMEDRVWKTEKTAIKGEAVHATATDREWEIRLQRLLAYGGWIASEYGPPPTRPGHCVPDAIHARWLTLWTMQGSHPLKELDDGSNLVPYPSDRFDQKQRDMWEPQQ
jgi:hypothetical protein